MSCDRNWELIEDENYRVLADAVFERDEPGGEDSLHGEAQSDQRPVKRSRSGQHDDDQASGSKTSGGRKLRNSVVVLNGEANAVPKPSLSKLERSCDVVGAMRGHGENKTVKGTQSAPPRTSVLEKDSDAGHPCAVRRKQHNAIFSMTLRERATGSIDPQVPSVRKRRAPESSSPSVSLKDTKVDPPPSSSPKGKSSTSSETLNKSSATNGQEMKMQRHAAELGRSSNSGSRKPSDVIQSNGSMKRSSARGAQEFSGSHYSNLNISSSQSAAEVSHDSRISSSKTRHGRKLTTSVIGINEAPDVQPKSTLSKLDESCNVAEATKGHTENGVMNLPEISGHLISKVKGRQNDSPKTSVVVKNSDAGQPSDIIRERHDGRSKMTLRERAKGSNTPTEPSTQRRRAPGSSSLAVTLKDTKVEPSPSLSLKVKSSTSNETMNICSATGVQEKKIQGDPPKLRSSCNSGSPKPSNVIQANGSMKKCSAVDSHGSPSPCHTRLNGSTSPSAAELPHGKCKQVSSSMDVNSEVAKNESGQKISIEDLKVPTLECTENPQATREGSRPLSSISDIAKGQEKVVITIVNEVNNELPPSFCYIPQSEVFEKAYVNFCLARIGDDNCCASCSGDCLLPSLPCACAAESGGEFAYTLDGVVKDKFLKESISMNRDPKKHSQFYCKECPLERSKCEDTMNPCKGHLVRKFIKECWRKCGCGKQCGNRVVQRGITHNLQVFMTPEGKGWGLRTLEDLPKGAFVCEYVGEVLTNAELFERVSRRQQGEKHSYPVLLDADWCVEGVLKDEEALCLDATYYGNVARFINHRCYDSNLVEIPVEVEGPDHHYYHLAFFTTRKVKAKEELTWDYGIDFDDHEHPIKAFQCQCGSKFCRSIKRTRSRTCRR